MEDIYREWFQVFFTSLALSKTCVSVVQLPDNSVFGNYLQKAALAWERRTCLMCTLAVRKVLDGNINLC